MRFNDWLRMKMDERRLKDADVAEACHVTKGAVGRWLKGTRQPERLQVIMLSKLFETPPNTILWMTDPEAMSEELGKEMSQKDYASLLAHVPELGDIVEGMWRLPTEQRAAIIVVIRSMLPPPPEQ